MKFKILLIFSFLILFPAFLYAAADLEITPEGIWFSTEKFFVGDRVKIHAVVENRGDKDMVGFVVFFDKGNQIGEPHFISARAGGKAEGVWAEWTPTEKRNLDILVKIVSTYPPDEIFQNDQTNIPLRLIDLDTDGDDLGNEEDLDDDNDGLYDWDEKKLGTDLKKRDTDGDGVGDKEDAFPLDSSKYKNTKSISSPLSPPQAGEFKSTEALSQEKGLVSSPATVSPLAGEKIEKDSKFLTSSVQIDLSTAIEKNFFSNLQHPIFFFMVLLSGILLFCFVKELLIP